MAKLATTNDKSEGGGDKSDEGDMQGHDGEHLEVSNDRQTNPRLLLWLSPSAHHL